MTTGRAVHTFCAIVRSPCGVAGALLGIAGGAEEVADSRLSGKGGAAATPETPSREVAAAAEEANVVAGVADGRAEEGAEVPPRSRDISSSNACKFASHAGSVGSTDKSVNGRDPSTIPMPPPQSRDVRAFGSSTMGTKRSAPLVRSAYSNSFLSESYAPFLPATRSRERCDKGREGKATSAMRASQQAHG